MNTLVRLVRNDPPDYPWELSARAELARRIASLDLRWRSYCLAQAAAATLDAMASALGPFPMHTSRHERRELCISNLQRGRQYLGMAAKKW